MNNTQGYNSAHAVATIPISQLNANPAFRFTELSMTDREQRFMGTMSVTIKNLYAGTFEFSGLVVNVSKKSRITSPYIMVKIDKVIGSSHMLKAQSQTQFSHRKSLKVPFFRPSLGTRVKVYLMQKTNRSKEIKGEFELTGRQCMENSGRKEVFYF